MEEKNLKSFLESVQRIFFSSNKEFTDYCLRVYSCKILPSDSGDICQLIMVNYAGIILMFQQHGKNKPNVQKYFRENLVDVDNLKAEAKLSQKEIDILNDADLIDEMPNFLEYYKGVANKNNNFWTKFIDLM